MKLAILQNPDVIEKNQYRIRIQRPKISEDLLVSSNAQKKGHFFALCYLFAYKQPPDNYSVLASVVSMSLWSYT